MIYDTFCYFNEDDVLDIRLNTLKDVVDKFIIIEANKTFSGDKKIQKFDFVRFKDFLDKIIYVYLEDMPDFKDPWSNENYQRNYALKILERENCADDDIVIISDLDEIPSPNAVEKFKESQNGICALSQKFFNVYLNLFNSSETPWNKGRICRYKEFFNPKNDIPPTFALTEEANRGVTPTKIRMNYIPSQIADAGWHFSYIGNAEKISYKIKSFAHQEFNKEEYTNVDILQARINANEDVLGRNQTYYKVEIDETFPEYLRNNLDKFDEYILK